MRKKNKPFFIVPDFGWGGGGGTIAQSRAFPASRNKPLECITWDDMSEFLTKWLPACIALAHTDYLNVRHGPFDIQGGGGLGFFSKKNSLLGFWLKKIILLNGTVKKIICLQ